MKRIAVWSRRWFLRGWTSRANLRAAAGGIKPGEHGRDNKQSKQNQDKPSAPACPAGFRATPWTDLCLVADFRTAFFAFYECHTKRVLLNIRRDFPALKKGVKRVGRNWALRLVVGICVIPTCECVGRGREGCHDVLGCFWFFQLSPPRVTPKEAGSLEAVIQQPRRSLTVRSGHTPPPPDHMMARKRQ